MMADSFITEVLLDQAPWHQFQNLLDACYPKPPRNVFERVVAASHRRQRLWLASDNDGLHGLVMLSPHSKGGHLDNLAVLPSARGRGIGQRLVKTLLHAVTQEEGTAMVSLTTRIPNFFQPMGFEHCGLLADGSTAMLTFLSELSVSQVATL